MSFDLYENENLDAVSSMPPVQDVPAGFFGGMEYIPNLAMRSAAVAGRATSLLASAPLVLLDRIKGDTSLEDRYFKQHEDVYQRAVDYWTPKPNEVGTAAQLVGDMLFTLPTAIAAPPIALGSAYAGTAEDLVRQGVDPTQAQAVGGVQSAGLALGLWMPILGKNLWQRTVVGGAGFNALQGIATRGASQAILSDTEAKDQFHAFDGEALTLDVLMGLGFGTFAHLSPEQRAQGEATWNRISEWAQQMSPSQKAAIATLREAQHLNVDSVPGKPVDPVDVEAHVNRMRQAIDQLVNDQPVQVSDLPEPKLEADPAREAQTQENYRNLADAAEQVRQDEGIPQVSEVGKTITERLMDIGVPPQEAADKGLLWDSFFKSMSDKTGQDAQQLFGKYFDRVFDVREQTYPARGMQSDIHEAYYQSSPKPTFYSQLSRTVADAPEKVFGTAAQFKQWLTSNAGKLGVKKDEIEWTGINDWLDAQGKNKVSKADIAAYLEQGGVKVEEVMLGKASGPEWSRQADEIAMRDYGRAYGELPFDEQASVERDIEIDNTKFSTYQLPGGENYRELLLTLPEKNAPTEATMRQFFADYKAEHPNASDTTLANEWAKERGKAQSQQFRSSHFDQPNILAHVRFNERTDAEGKRVLFLEEIQSDWAQRGRKEGFKQESKYRYEVFDSKTGDIVGGYDNEDAALRATQVRGDDGLYHLDYRRTGEDVGPGNKVPAAPFVQKTEAWTALALKRMIRYAADNGFDAIAWTTGIQQAERYIEHLRQRVKSIKWKQAERGGITIVDIKPVSGERIYLPVRDGKVYRTADQASLRGKDLADVIGKEAAAKVAEQESGMLEGDGLTIGAEGMKGYYDQIVPQVANDVLKKLGGGKVGEITISDRAPKTLDTIMREEFGIGYGEATDQQLQHALAIKNTPNGSYAIASQKVIKRGDLEGGRPSVEFVPDERFGRFKTVMKAKAHYMREMDNALRNASDEYAAKHFDQQARNVGDIKVVKVDPVYGKGEDKRYPATQQPGFDITPAMREKVMAGLPLFQKTGDGARGFLEFGQNGKMGIGLLASADKSTFLHESGHFFLEVMNDLSKEAEPLRADIDALHQWMGVQGDTPEARAQAWDAMSLDEKRPMHEQFARGFEQYLMEGKAPNSRLAEAFARFRDWLIEIYKSATALNVQITDEVRAVMDRMLDSKAKAPQSPPGGDVPPPRVMAGEATAADLDKVLASGEPNLENHKPLSDPDVQGMLQDMALNEAGWAEKGGYLLRSGSEVAGEEVISRTKWIPKAEWWADRPAQGKRRLNEEQVKEAVRKAIAGEPLKPLEQSTVDFMAAIANDRIQGVEQVGPNGWDDAMQWVNRFNEPPTTENVFDYLAMERAIEINPEAANAAMDAYNIHNDDALVMAEFRSIINEKIQQDSQSVSGGAGEGGGEKPAGQPDPIEAEARRIADADPSRTISLGTDANGEPVKMTVAEYLDAAKMEADQARKDVSLIQAAAECLMGNL